jgi:hypothetical protein
MAAGRPLKFRSPKALQKSIEEFFELCKKNGEIPLVEGLALHLDTNCQTLLNYTERSEYAPIIQKAKLRIAANFMQRSCNGHVNPTLAIFIANNHYDYKHKEHIMHGGQKDAPIEIKTDYSAKVLDNLTLEQLIKIKEEIAHGEPA